MIDHPLALGFALLTGVLPGGLILWGCDVRSWISWIAMVGISLTMLPGLAIFILGRFRKQPRGRLLVLVFGVPAIVRCACAGLILLLGGTGPDAALHWLWLWPLLGVGGFVGMGGIFAGAAYAD